jgi:hypothetical protein
MRHTSLAGVGTEKRGPHAGHDRDHRRKIECEIIPQWVMTSTASTNHSVVTLVVDATQR